MDLTVPLLIATTLTLPGPTNALLAVAGARTGTRLSLPLITAPLAGYALALAALMSLVTPLLAVLPQLAVAVRFAAAAVLIHAALRLWRLAGQTAIPSTAGTMSASWREVFLTTLMNPKAIVLYVAIAPQGTGIDWTAALLTPVLIVAASLIWLMLGGQLAALRPGLKTHGLIERGGAIVLAIFAALMSTSALAAMLA